MDIEPPSNNTSQSGSPKPFQKRNNVPRDKKQLKPFVRDDNIIREKLSHLNGPVIDLPPLKFEEKKFSGRSRLFIGNLPSRITEEEISELFKKFGETSEIYINKSYFGFIKLDFYANAKKAKEELNGSCFKGKILAIRLSHPASVLVTNLSPCVTDELLHIAFSVFGDIEMCFILTHDHGKPTGKGVVQYVKKSSALSAVSRCTDGCYLVTSSLKPVSVELYDPVNDFDGYPEALIRKTPEYYNERRLPPRLATPGSLEHDFAMRWKELYAKHAEKLALLKRELLFEEQKLESEAHRAQYDRETERLKEEIRLREREKNRIQQEWEMRQQQFKSLHGQGGSKNEGVGLMPVQDDGLFREANRLCNLLDREEEQLEEKWNVPSEANLRQRRFKGPENVGMGRWQNYMDPNGSYNLKRRRF